MNYGLFRQANTLLNQRAIELNGDTVSFLVHPNGVTSNSQEISIARAHFEYRQILRFMF